PCNARRILGLGEYRLKSGAVGSAHPYLDHEQLLRIPQNCTTKDAEQSTVRLEDLRSRRSWRTWRRPMTTATLILENGRIATMRRRDETVDAVAICGDRVLAVGSNREIRDFAGPRTRRIDLGGRFACPGLIDAHAHVELGSMAR